MTPPPLWLAPGRAGASFLSASHTSLFTPHTLVRLPSFNLRSGRHLLILLSRQQPPSSPHSFPTSARGVPFLCGPAPRAISPYLAAAMDPLRSRGAQTTPSTPHPPSERQPNLNLEIDLWRDRHVGCGGRGRREVDGGVGRGGGGGGVPDSFITVGTNKQRPLILHPQNFHPVRAPIWCTASC